MMRRVYGLNEWPSSEPFFGGRILCYLTERSLHKMILYREQFLLEFIFIVIIIMLFATDFLNTILMGFYASMTRRFLRQKRRGAIKASLKTFILMM